ncbi:hypothetical protein [Synechococcus sp. PCC 7336]|uniref:hypothetical protein n=1 Tax=Synechococcus sp. PCC 7336 TaxID=195250 RepID=UPI00035C5F0F|nr:hypothetical protein [Synechococcus sp. PCC 7336]
MSILKPLRKLLRPIRTAFSCLKILEIEYGHYRSSDQWTCLDKIGNPIPWYTYSTIEYLKQLDFSDKIIFEYGSGNSSLFWANRAKKVISVEDNSQWFDKVSKYNSKNLEIQLIEEKLAYTQSIQKYENFDTIIIDGSHRKACAKEAIQKLNPGGMIVLDNSDWFPKTAEIIRYADFIQVDMAGFGPINYYTWTTSLFLHREFNLKPKSSLQPTHAPGALAKHIDLGT